MGIIRAIMDRVRANRNRRVQRKKDREILKVARGSIEKAGNKTGRRYWNG